MNRLYLHLDASLADLIDQNDDKNLGGGAFHRDNSGQGNYVVDTEVKSYQWEHFSECILDKDVQKLLLSKSSNNSQLISLFANLEKEKYFTCELTVDPANTQLTSVIQALGGNTSGTTARITLPKDIRRLTADQISALQWMTGKQKNAAGQEIIGSNGKAVRNFSTLGQLLASGNTEWANLLKFASDTTASIKTAQDTKPEAAEGPQAFSLSGTVGKATQWVDSTLASGIDDKDVAQTLAEVINDEESSTFDRGLAWVSHAAVTCLGGLAGFGASAIGTASIVYALPSLAYGMAVEGKDIGTAWDENMWFAGDVENLWHGLSTFAFGLGGWAYAGLEDLDGTDDYTLEDWWTEGFAKGIFGWDKNESFAVNSSTGTGVIASFVVSGIAAPKLGAAGKFIMEKPSVARVVRSRPFQVATAGYRPVTWMAGKAGQFGKWVSEPGQGVMRRPIGQMLANGAKKAANPVVRALNAAADTKAGKAFGNGVANAADAVFGKGMDQMLDDAFGITKDQRAAIEKAKAEKPVQDPKAAETAPDAAAAAAKKAAFEQSIPEKSQTVQAAIDEAVTPKTSDALEGNVKEARHQLEALKTKAKEAGVTEHPILKALEGKVEAVELAAEAIKLFEKADLKPADVAPLEARMKAIEAKFDANPENRPAAVKEARACIDQLTEAAKSEAPKAAEAPAKKGWAERTKFTSRFGELGKGLAEINKMVEDSVSGKTPLSCSEAAYKTCEGKIEALKKRCLEVLGEVPAEVKIAEAKLAAERYVHETKWRANGEGQHSIWDGTNLDAIRTDLTTAKQALADLGVVDLARYDSALAALDLIEQASKALRENYFLQDTSRTVDAVTSLRNKLRDIRTAIETNGTVKPHAKLNDAIDALTAEVATLREAAGLAPEATPVSVTINPSAEAPASPAKAAGSLDALKLRAKKTAFEFKLNGKGPVKGALDPIIEQFNREGRGAVGAAAVLPDLVAKVDALINEANALYPETPKALAELRADMEAVAKQHGVTLPDSPVKASGTGSGGSGGTGGTGGAGETSGATGATAPKADAPASPRSTSRIGAALDAARHPLDALSRLKYNKSTVPAEVKAMTEALREWKDQAPDAAALDALEARQAKLVEDGRKLGVEPTEAVSKLGEEIKAEKVKVAELAAKNAKISQANLAVQTELGNLRRIAAGEPIDVAAIDASIAKLDESIATLDQVGSQPDVLTATRAKQAGNALKALNERMPELQKQLAATPMDTGALVLALEKVQTQINSLNAAKIDLPRSMEAPYRAAKAIAQKVTAARNAARALNQDLIAQSGKPCTPAQIKTFRERIAALEKQLTEAGIEGNGTLTTIKTAFNRTLGEARTNLAARIDAALANPRTTSAQLRALVQEMADLTAEHQAVSTDALGDMGVEFAKRAEKLAETIETKEATAAKAADPKNTKEQKVCPCCNKTFDAWIEFCFDDGTPLVKAAGEASPTGTRTDFDPALNEFAAEGFIPEKPAGEPVKQAAPAENPVPANTGTTIDWRPQKYKDAIGEARLCETIGDNNGAFDAYTKAAKMAEEYGWFEEAAGLYEVASHNADAAGLPTEAAKAMAEARRLRKITPQDDVVIAYEDSPSNYNAGQPIPSTSMNPTPARQAKAADNGSRNRTSKPKKAEPYKPQGSETVEGTPGQNPKGRANGGRGADKETRRVESEKTSSYKPTDTDAIYWNERTGRWESALDSEGHLMSHVPPLETNLHAVPDGARLVIQPDGSRIVISKSGEVLGELSKRVQGSYTSNVGLADRTHVTIDRQTYFVENGRIKPFTEKSVARCADGNYVVRNGEFHKLLEGDLVDFTSDNTLYLVENGEMSLLRDREVVTYPDGSAYYVKNGALEPYVEGMVVDFGESGAFVTARGELIAVSEKSVVRYADGTAAIYELGALTEVKEGILFETTDGQLHFVQDGSLRNAPETPAAISADGYAYNVDRGGRTLINMDGSIPTPEAVMIDGIRYTVDPTTHALKLGQKVSKSYSGAMTIFDAARARLQSLTQNGRTLTATEAASLQAECGRVLGKQRASSTMTATEQNALTQSINWLRQEIINRTAS